MVELADVRPPRPAAQGPEAEAIVVSERGSYPVAEIRLPRRVGHTQRAVYRPSPLEREEGAAVSVDDRLGARGRVQVRLDRGAREVVDHDARDRPPEQL